MPAIAINAIHLDRLVAAPLSFLFLHKCSLEISRAAVGIITLMKGNDLNRETLENLLLSPHCNIRLAQTTIWQAE